ncbi:MAG: ParB/RepB/Spo0J family partition protein [Ignavibacteriae bacterium]|nr:ParB/RepB/Spo0J family partition protein [Ignavibacteriota bacterium]
MTPQKGGLGRGLSALIPSAQPQQQVQSSPTEQPEVVAQQPQQQEAETGNITHIELAKVRPNPFQPRADFNQDALDELKQSISQKGIIQAITVRKTGDGYFELISGERRVRASQELGLPTIPAYIIEVNTNEEMLELALVENLQREHLNPIEIAISYQRLISDVGLSVEDIGNKIGKDRTTIANFLRLLKLPEQIQKSVRNGKLSAGHARALLSLPNEQTQLRVFERVTKDELSVRQVEKLVKQTLKKIELRDVITPASAFTPIPSVDVSVKGFEEHLQRILGTKVRIRIGQEGRGEIMLEYYSNDDLQRLLELLNQIPH